MIKKQVLDLNREYMLTERETYGLDVNGLFKFDTTAQQFKKITNPYSNDFTLILVADFQ